MKSSQFSRLSTAIAVTASLLAAAFPANANAAPTPDPTLLGHWTFDDPANPGTPAAGKYPATFGSDIKITPGLLGNAAEFSSTDTKGTKITVSHDILPLDLRQLTFAAWIAPKSLKGAEVNLFRKEDVGAMGENRLYFGFQLDGKFLSLGLNCGGNYSELDALISPAEILDGRWHHVAGTFDGKTMRVYLDAREIGSYERHAPLNTFYDYVPTSRHNGNTLSNTGYNDVASAIIRGAPLTLGGSVRNTGTPTNTLNGKLDDARFYARALAPEEIAALVKAGNQPPNEALEKAQADTRKEFDPYYKKTVTFSDTVATTVVHALANAARETVTPENKLKNDLSHLELFRRIRADFPEDANAYIAKWQRSPLSLLDSDIVTTHWPKVIAEASEYMPLTDFQWAALSAPERAKWERARKALSLVKSLTEKTVATVGEQATIEAISALFFLETLVNDRPRVRERVAQHTEPATPITVTRTAAEARKIIEDDWLFQSAGKPNIGAVLAEIALTRKLAARLGLPAPAGLADIEAKAKMKSVHTVDIPLYFAVRTLKREITFKNPVLDFDSILYIDNPYPSGSEWNHETRHRLGYMGVPGGRLLVQKGLQPDGHLTQLLPQAPLHGTFWRPDVSFDATRALVSYKPHNEKTFHIYEIGLDGTGLRQLTGGMFDDFDPIYLPDGKNLMFTTSRGYNYVRCMPPTNSMVMARLPLDSKPGDKNLYIVSRNGEPEYTPSVMRDGRVLYTRWEYTDKSVFRGQSLWTMNSSATNVQTLWGNQSVWPDLPKDARQIPGSNRVMFTGSAHHNWFSGCIGIIDPDKGLNFPHGLTKVTQELPWPECGNGPVDPKENDTYHTSGKYSAYYSPYPLSEKDFLVSALRKGKFVLLLMDTDGNREIINEGHFNIWDAQPVRKRAVPKVQPDLVDWPTWETRDKPATGTMYSNNVYENAPPEVKDKARYLRIWSIEAKTYTYWHRREYISSGPAVSAVQSEGVKRIIGTVPIEADGSVNFSAPSGIPLHFQLLDENQRTLHTMKSFTGVQPGETRACFGCHEQKMNAPASKKIGQAFRRAPSTITPVPWNDITIGYERYVQPALDKYCGNCHANETTPAHKAFNSKLRPGFLGFKEPYMTFLGWPTWGAPHRKIKPYAGGFGWADTILPDSYSQTDPAAYATFPPMKRLSYASRLVKRMDGGKISAGDKHPVVKADAESLLRVILWVDALAPYHGAEELSKMEDPLFQGRDWLSQRPRIQTAPRVQRPGPFDAFHTDTDPAYDAPTPEKLNALPHGVVRK